MVSLVDIELVVTRAAHLLFFMREVGRDCAQQIAEAPVHLGPWSALEDGAGSNIHEIDEFAMLMIDTGITHAVLASPFNRCHCPTSQSVQEEAASGRIKVDGNALGRG